MQCCFCGKEVESILHAIHYGWYPDFWHGQINYMGPVCAECQQEHLIADESGECVLKPGHSLPPAATPSVEGSHKLCEVKTRLVMPPKFSPGQVVATPAALQAIEESGQTPEFFLDQHVHGQWGAVCGEYWRANDRALADGSRILSEYLTLKGVRIWILTEAVGDDGNRPSSAILLSSEYRAGFPQ